MSGRITIKEKFSILPINATIEATTTINSENDDNEILFCWL